MTKPTAAFLQEGASGKREESSSQVDAEEGLGKLGDPSSPLTPDRSQVARGGDPNQGRDKDILLAWYLTGM